ncbi:nucleoside phosphorylase [Streptomyces sp. NPDC090106]|uniref:nucleoside phosphorylase n=1 Tax=Streptomyces sp. NPDC090106 TaxID=3365946 RepID=UPI0038238277
MTTADILPITKLPRGKVPTRALVVGDPARAERIAGMLDKAQEIARNREYASFEGSWKGVSVLVSSHGVGGPGAICQFQELIDAGADTILRLGTAGAMVPGLGDGDLVIAEAAVRDDGVTQQLLPPEYPSFATPEVVCGLTATAERLGLAYRRGVVWTRAAFYPAMVHLPLKEYARQGVLAIEMELSALLVMAQSRGIRSGGVLVIDGAAADDLVDTTGYDPHRAVVAEGVERAITLSLDALVEL